jgi:hypothetical protein
MTKFIHGLQLGEKFFKKIVEPVLEERFPRLKYSAGIIGEGSDVLGFDTKQSTDHDWGPRTQLFISEKDSKKRSEISDYLANNFPLSFLGYSTNYAISSESGSRVLSKQKPGQPINHRVEIYTVKSFFKEYLCIDPFRRLNTLDWLVLSEQKLRTLRSGKLFHDELGVGKIKGNFHYFPRDVWLYMLACEWKKIGQEEPFVARAGDVGDDLGSKIIASRLAKSIMRLCFLMEKEYVPYSKWFGTAFSQLNCSGRMLPAINKVLLAKKWKKREKHLSEAVEIVAEMHNSLKLTKPIKAKVSSFHNRPYLVIHGDVFANEIKKLIKSAIIKNIPADIGSVSQLSDTVDLLENNMLLSKLKGLYKC